MKKYVLSIIVLSFSVLSIGQATLKEKLNEVYSQARVKDILEDEQKKKYFTNILFHSSEIISVPLHKLKPNSFPVLNSINLFEKNSVNKKPVDISEIIELYENGSFNILLVDIQREMEETLRFRLGKTNKILVIYSYDYLTKLQKK